MIEGLRIDVTASESSRRLERRNQPDFQALELGAAAGEGLSGRGGRS